MPLFRNVAIRTLVGLQRRIFITRFHAHYRHALASLSGTPHGMEVYVRHVSVHAKQRIRMAAPKFGRTFRLFSVFQTGLSSFLPKSSFVSTPLLSLVEPLYGF